MQEFTIVVEAISANKRLDQFVSEVCGISRSLSQQLITAAQVVVNHKKAAKSYRIEQNDIIGITIPPPVDTRVVAQNIPLTIVFEDDYLLVVNKPKGMVVHPAAGNPDGTLVNALLFHCGKKLSQIGGEIRPGIVHRIDKDTSGLLVVAKDDATHNGLVQQFSIHSIDRIYQAVVYGRCKAIKGTIDEPIGRHPIDRKKMAVVLSNSKRAVTHYTVISPYKKFSHMELQLETGRTHQIRVHMASIGHPVAGDALYGPKKVITSLRGQCLHAGTLGFEHPATGEHMLFTSALPEYFTAFIKQLEKE